MKYLVILMALLGFYSKIFSQSNSTIHSIGEEYCASTDSPKLFQKGDTLIIDCDSVYIINKIRYKFYKDMHKATVEESDAPCKDILLVYENRLKEHEDAYSKILNNCKKTEQVSLDLIDYTQESLMNTQKSLQYTQQTLDYSIQSLDKANKLIKKEKQASKFEKVLIGIGGAGIGILTGVLISQ